MSHPLFCSKFFLLSLSAKIYLFMAIFYYLSLLFSHEFSQIFVKHEHYLPAQIKITCHSTVHELEVRSLRLAHLYVVVDLVDQVLA